MAYTRIGTLCGAEFGTAMDDQHYYLRIEATPVIAAIIQAMGWACRYLGPEQDSGRLWFLVPYTAQVDEWIAQTVDALADARCRKPNFGQFKLFDDSEAKHG